MSEWDSDLPFLQLLSLKDQHIQELLSPEHKDRKIENRWSEKQLKKAVFQYSGSSVLASVKSVI